MTHNTVINSTIFAQALKGVERGEKESGHTLPPKQKTAFILALHDLIQEAAERGMPTDGRALDRDTLGQILAGLEKGMADYRLKLDADKKLGLTLELYDIIQDDAGSKKKKKKAKNKRAK